MSTEFAIFKKIPPLHENGEVNWGLIAEIENETDEYQYHITVAFRFSEIFWKDTFVPIEPWLDDGVPVFPLDNAPQGIYTLGDIRREIEEQDKSQK